MIQTENPMPSAPESEQVVLGAVLYTPELVADIIETLPPLAFMNNRNRVIYDAVISCYSEFGRADHADVTAYLKKTGTYSEAGANTEIVELLDYALSVRADDAPDSDQVKHHAKQVLDAYQRRRLIQLGAKIQETALTEQAENVIQRAENSLLTIQARSVDSKMKPVSSYADQAIDNLIEDMTNPNRMKGLPSGLHGLDAITKGFRPNSLNIIGARPYMGKTTLAINLCLNIVQKEERPVLFFSLEMSEQQLFEVMMLNLAGGLSDRDKIMTAGEKLKTLPLFYEEAGSMTLTTIKSRIKQITLQHSLPCLVVVDHMGLMTGSNAANRVNEVSEISRGLKQIAMDTTIPFLVPCQLNRGVESRDNKRPNMSDLRDSGSIEQDADVIMLLYRDEYYNPETTEKPGILEIDVQKVRGERPSKVDMVFRPAAGRVLDTLPTRQDSYWKRSA